MSTRTDAILPDDLNTVSRVAPLRRSRALWLCLAILAAALLDATAAQASIIVTLSDASTTAGLSPSLLDAQLAFSLSGSTLSLTVRNQTAGANAFYINNLFFNATSNVTGLALIDPTTGWTLDFAQGGSSKVGSLGTFDVGLTGGVGNSPYEIPAGGSLTFQFNVTGTNLSAANFTTDLSNPTGANPGYLAAANFIRGPGDASSNGGGNATPTVGTPEPATLAMLLLGVGGLWRFRRKA
jgi:hypothetical protein